MTPQADGAGGTSSAWGADAFAQPLSIDRNGALRVTVVSEGGLPVRIVEPQLDAGPWLVVVLLLVWAFVLWRLRSYGEMRRDLQHPSEIAPDGCYDEEGA